MVFTAVLVGNQAVLRNHHRQAAVDHRLAGEHLPEIPDLLQAQLKGQAGALEAPLLQTLEGAGVEHVKPQIPPGDEAALQS